MRRLSPGAFVLLFLFSVSSAKATIRYSVSLDHPEQHFFHVRMTVPNAGSDFTVQMPAWNALYQIRDFASRVQSVRAKGGDGGPGAEIVVTKLDKQTWRIGPRPGVAGTLSVMLEYAIYWDDPGPFNSQLNLHHAFVNPAEILFYLPDRRSEDVLIEYTDLPAAWKMAQELPAGPSANSFVALSYDALADAPAELSAFSEFRFEESGAKVRVVVDAETWHETQLSEVLHRIVGYETQLMGGAPFTEYTFFFHFGAASEVGGGGMEHSNCTAISVSSDDNAGGVAAHEFFHLWNVKRIRPQTLEPVDYTNEMYTRALWFAEGVTSTYGAYTLERAGLWSRKAWYGDLASQIEELQSTPARQWTSAEQASLDVWFEKYSLYRSPDFSISYYNKGQILGVLLDLQIRSATQNHASLDHVLRVMNEEFAKRHRYYHDSVDIETVAEQACNCKLDDFFAQYVSGTREIPYAEFLALAGLKLKTKSRTVADLGFRLARGPGNSMVVTALAPGSSAESAGIHTGDVLLSINGEPVPHDINDWLQGRPVDQMVRVRVRRDGGERDLSFALSGREMLSYEIEEDSHATNDQKRIREGLLHGTTD
jgi:predicted metalloprotease with PDZ domain